jgi:tetratricopeptide (TPR) repeat protein
MPSKRWPLIGSLPVVALMCALALPYAISAYHLHAGGRALEQALGRHDALEWWYVGPREAREPRALQAAIAHLEKAARAPYAQRLLGQAYVAQGEPLRGVQELEQFVEHRPKHYLAQLELAAAYVYADARLHQLEYLDLLTHLEGARVSAPDQTAPVRYTADGWQSDYVYPTAYSLPPEYGDRPALFLHAGSQVTWTVPLTAPSVLRFGMGQAPRSLGWGGDGATFEVFVDGARVFLEHLPVAQARQGWHEREVDLAVYTGQTIRLSLATTPGPVGDVTGDWAGWGEPRLEDAQADAYRHKVRGKPWLTAWKTLGVSLVDFARAAKAALEDQQYDQALAWAAWMEWVNSSSGLAYHDLSIGLLHLENDSWPDALDAFERAAQSSKSEEYPLGTLHYQIGKIQQDQLEQWDSALSNYELALASEVFLSDIHRADTYYRAGVIHKYKGEHQTARDKLLSAIEIIPYHYGALIELGKSYWQIDGNLDLAEETLLRAANASSTAKWAYKTLGDLYSEENRYADAISMYKRVLEIDPADQQAQTKLEALRTP